MTEKQRFWCGFVVFWACVIAFVLLVGLAKHATEHPAAPATPTTRPVDEYCHYKQKHRNLCARCKAISARSAAK